MRFLNTIAIAVVGTCLLTATAFARDISFSTSDGLTIFADEHVSAKGKEGPLLILFHQAGANGRAEYAYAIPRFLEAGYNLLVVDQRSGGDRFGKKNRTVIAGGKSTGYCEAYPDLEAALYHAKSSGYTGPIFAVGSSYSAGLVIPLGAKNSGKIAGVIAFSPASGGPMKECSPNEFAATTQTPTMVLRPAREMEVPSAAAQFEHFKKAGHTMFVAEKGVHGSSMLDPSRTKSDTEETWQAVLSFLKTNQ